MYTPVLAMATIQLNPVIIGQFESLFHDSSGTGARKREGAQALPYIIYYIYCIIL